MLIIDYFEGRYEKGTSYLYWIHQKDQKDISREGYVGISSNPKSRCHNHNRAFANADSRRIQGYSKSFCSAYDKGDLIFEVVNAGTHYEVQRMERMLRPERNIGFNVMVGGYKSGASGKYKHGGSTDNIGFNKFTNMVKYCQNKNIFVDFNFLTDSGFRLFQLHQEDQAHLKSVAQTKITLLDESKGFILGNYRIQPVSINSDCDKWVEYDGRWWSKVEACRYTNTNVKTADKRLTKYRYTRLQAVGFEKPPEKNYKTVTLGGVECRYNTKLSGFSEDQLKLMFDYYISGKRGFKRFCNNLGFECGNMVRYFRRYGFERTLDDRFKH